MKQKLRFRKFTIKYLVKSLKMRSCLQCDKTININELYYTRRKSYISSSDIGICLICLEKFLANRANDLLELKNAIIKKGEKLTLSYPIGIVTPPTPELSYTNQDLLDLLNRHTGHKKEEKCDCDCPFTKNSIELLIRFVIAENNLLPDLAAKACYYLQQLQQDSCLMGNRKVIAAALFYLANIRYGHQYRQYEVAKFFHVSPPSFRFKYKQILQVIPVTEINPSPIRG